MEYSIYYQARIKKELAWILTSTMKYSENISFDRCFDKENSIFEFFVAPDLEEDFLEIIKKLEKKEVVLDLKKLPNRYLK